MASTNKARYWTAVLYPESMISDWESVISEKLQIPYAYCIHDKDMDKNGDVRKKHVHIVVVFPNTTTYNNALSLFKELGEVSNCQRVQNIRFMYDYLIHDNDDCRKKNKYVYDASERICGNSFDIGAYEQITLADKHSIVADLSKRILVDKISNYADFYAMVLSEYDTSTLDIIYGYSGHFERLTRGNYLKYHSNGNSAENG